MTDLVDILIPEDQQEGTELELSAWLKRVGDAVAKDEPIAELTTDKAVVEIPAPAAGVLHEILVEADGEVGFASVLGRIKVGDVSSEAEAPTVVVESIHKERPRPNLQNRGDRPPPHPAVARFAAKSGLDLASLTGRGQGGRVTRADVMSALGRAQPSSPAAAPAAAAKQSLPEISGPSRMVKHGPMRKSIARNMAQSVTVAPHVTAVFSCDLSRVLAHRAANKDAFAKRGSKLTFSAYFLRATHAAVQAVPEVNARWHDDALEVFEHLHVGVGAALEDKGLVVPVIKDVQDLDLEQCAARLTELTDKARAGKLAPAEMKGSTFTISNHGVMGSLIASPIIINQPESAILGIGKLEKRAVVVDDQVQVRPMIYVTLTIDHRVLDAFHTNRFLTTFCDTLEQWPD